MAGTVFIAIASFPCTALGAEITVNSRNDAALPNIDGNCTLREAIEAAETNRAVDGCVAGRGADTILFEPTIEEIEIAAGNLSDFSNPIRESLTISGPPINKVDIYGDNLFQLFFLDSLSNDQTFRFSGLRIQEGLADRGGAISLGEGETLEVENTEFVQNTATNGGGAIYVNPAPSGVSLSVNTSVFEGNRAQGPTGGGAIRSSNGAIIEIQNSTFVGNAASAASGGAILAFSNFDGGENLAINNSTFSGNRTVQSGGAVMLAGNVALNITNSTLFANIADEDGTEVGIEGGGGIALGPRNPLAIKNTILANIDGGTNINLASDILKLSSSVVESVPIVSLGFNFVSNNSGAASAFTAGFPNDNNDYVGSSSSILDPRLSPLQDHGGPTETHRITTISSPANAGFCSDERTDQRGFGNPETGRRAVLHPEAPIGLGSDGCDIGAVESFAEEVEFTIPDEEQCIPIKANNDNVVVICL